MVIKSCQLVMIPSIEFPPLIAILEASVPSSEISF